MAGISLELGSQRFCDLRIRRSSPFKSDYTLYFYSVQQRVFMFSIYGNIHSPHLTLMAYSPFILMLIFSAIIDLATSTTYNLPCQVLVNELVPQFGQVSPSTNNLQRRHTSRFAILFLLLFLTFCFNYWRLFQPF